MRFLPLALLFLATACAAQEKPNPNVEKAIKAGASFLEGRFRNARELTDHPHVVGTSALAGLAMIESNVPKTSRAVASIATVVRDQVFSNVKTYEVASMAMFLDRLGDPADKPLLQFLGIRLMLGQMRSGTWSYDCGEPVPAAEQERIRRVLAGKEAEPPPEPEGKKEPPKKVNPNVPQPVAPKKPAAAATPEDHATIHPAILRYLRIFQATARGEGDGDHSNTQFAIVGLWCARRAGVPVDAALQRAESGFRHRQMPDGGWDYVPSGTTSTATMTCAGLMAVTLGMGTKNSAQVMRIRDENTPTPVKEQPKAFNGIADAAIVRALIRIEAFAAQDPGLGSNLYFLWSLERVGMALAIDRIGRLDWYEWGGTLLLKTQNADGSWANGNYHGSNEELNTSFALLFLNKANLTQELTKSMRSRVDFNPGKPKEAKGTLPLTPRPVDVKNGIPVPVDDMGKEADKLALRLLRAGPAERGTVLAELRDNKGGVYTEALARAIVQGKTEHMAETREALAQRLKRMTKASLGSMLKDSNREIRLAAAKACGLKEDVEVAPDLIAALADMDDAIVQSCRASLKKLTGKDHGPEEGASPAQKSQAIQDWRKALNP